MGLLDRLVVGLAGGLRSAGDAGAGAVRGRRHRRADGRRLRRVPAAPVHRFPAALPSGLAAAVAGAGDRAVATGLVVDRRCVAGRCRAVSVAGRHAAQSVAAVSGRAGAERRGLSVGAAVGGSLRAVAALHRAGGGVGAGAAASAPAGTAAKGAERGAVGSVERAVRRGGAGRVFAAGTVDICIGAGAGFDRHHSRYRSAGARLPVCRRGVSGAERGRATGPLLSRAGHEPRADSDRAGDGHHGRDGGVQPQAGSDHATDSDRASRSGGVGVRTGNFLEAPVYSDQHSTAKDGAAESPLHAAVWAGDLDEVRRLVESGADVNWRDSIGETALFGAAAWGRVQAVRYLLSVGARHDFHESNGYTPLHWAAGHGDLETIRILVEAGANAAAPDKLGRLPVDVAHQQGKGSHVAYLKTVGPEIASRRKTRP
ncbi:MAG: ankyrin repeat domain-containing protein [Candidatus Competibacter sp.]